MRLVLFLSLLVFLTNCRPEATTATSEPVAPIAEEVAPPTLPHKRVTVYQSKDQGHYLLYGEEKVANQWIKTYASVRCTVGKNGIAAPGEKREGDGKTPAGEYEFGPVFAYENDLGLTQNFLDLESHHYWIDDSQSEHYNQLVDYNPAPVSAEKMLRNDNLYKYGLIINYNTAPIIRDMGSAIFLHIYRSLDSGTAGCVAIAEADIVELIHWLKDAERATIRILP